MPTKLLPTIRLSRYTFAIATLIATMSIDAAHGQFNTVINVPPDTIGDNESIGSNTQVNVGEGGAIGDDFQVGLAYGSSSNIEVNILDGVIGNSFHAYSGSEINIASGNVGYNLNAHSGSKINIAGGTVGRVLRANSGSQVNILGGSVGGHFEVKAGSVVNISGGSIGPSFSTEIGSQVTLTGGDFQLDGVAIEGLHHHGETVAFDIPEGSLLSGVLADGTPVVFSTQLLMNDWAAYPADRISAGTLTLQSSSIPEVGPASIRASIDSMPPGIREGQTLVVDAGGEVLESFTAGIGSRLVVEEGGIVGDYLKALGATVQIEGGVFGSEEGSPRLFAHNGTDVTISGGMVAGRMTLFRSEATIAGGSVNSVESRDGSTLKVLGGNVTTLAAGISEPGGYSASTFEGVVQESGQAMISGGNIEWAQIGDAGRVLIKGGDIDNLRLFNFANASGGEAAITGGIVRNLKALRGAELNISGGTVESLRVYGDSSVNLFGIEFTVDGVSLPVAQHGIPTAIETTNTIELRGVLADGSVFSSEDIRGTLTITLVSLLDGDYDSNGTVDQGDLDLVLLNWGEELFNPFDEGWMNDLPDGDIGQEELDKVLLNWGSSAVAGTAAGRGAAVPEPTTVRVLLLLAVAGILVFCTGNVRRTS